MSQPENAKCTLVFHLNYGDSGVVSVVEIDNLNVTVRALSSAPSSGEKDISRRALFLGLNDNGKALIYNPVTQAIAIEKACPADVNPSYSYVDKKNNRIWFVNDGDKETGNDALNCPQGGASVMVFSLDETPQLLKCICVGRGHHVISYIADQAFVSNLLDGTIMVLGNDDTDEANYLNILDTINLLEPGKEKTSEVDVPNNAFPHGMVYSSKTGKLYNLNNGYGTIAVIDPGKKEIINRIPLSVSSNLLMSPDELFLIGKGADRKSNSEHVMGRLSVVDLRTEKVVTVLDVPDYYPSTYRFSLDGSKLYVTSAATGKGVQRDNLKIDTVLVYDAQALPELKLINKLKVGLADCGRRPLAFAGGYVFIPNPSDGTMSVLDSKSDEILTTVKVGEPGCKEILFSFWQESVSGS